MEVKCTTYISLFQVLEDALIDRFFSEEKQANIKPLVKTLWTFKVKVKGEAIPLTIHYFNAQPMYLYNLRSNANKGGNVSIKDKVLIRILEFLNDTPESKRFTTGDEFKKAAELIKKYEDETFGNSDKKNTKTQIKNFGAEGLLHKEFDDCARALNQFLENLNIENCHTSWGLVTRDFQKHPFYDGDIYKFRSSIFQLKSCSDFSFGSWTYSSGFITCKAKYTEVRVLYDFPWVLELAEKPSNSWEKEEAIELIKQADDGLDYIFHKCGGGKLGKFEDLDERMLLNYDFQRGVFATSDISKYKKCLKIAETVNEKVQIQVKFRHEFGKWLIDYIHDFHPISAFIVYEDQ